MAPPGLHTVAWNTSSRPARVQDRSPMPNWVVPGAPVPLCHTPRAPVRVLSTWMLGSAPAALPTVSVTVHGSRAG